ncbi:MAG TPA: hypothetical protein VMU84_19795 [Thermoanaerobaculia bacterium]|nr:hypothetical protein [Thermoanaerobaculia bacterium]
MSGWTLLGLFAVAVIGFLVVSGWLRTWAKYRGLRVINCPENFHVIETFRREHPRDVVERTRMATVHHTLAPTTSVY